MSGADVAALVRAIAPALEDAKDELNRLDAVAGDGDLGLTAAAGAAALVELAPALEGLSEAEAIRKCGTELARRAPSTGGTLIAFAFLAAARAPVDDATPVLDRAAAYLAAGAAAITQRGGVGRGDRTMLDALGPAVDAIRDAAGRSEGVATALQAAARAADDGAAGTAAMAAKVGRAGWLAARAAGHEDAGARLIALVMDAAARRAGG